MCRMTQTFPHSAVAWPKRQAGTCASSCPVATCPRALLSRMTVPTAPVPLPHTALAHRKLPPLPMTPGCQSHLSLQGASDMPRIR